jgi:hypothetical protein
MVESSRPRVGDDGAGLRDPPRSTIRVVAGGSDRRPAGAGVDPGRPRCRRPRRHRGPTRDRRRGSREPGTDPDGGRVGGRSPAGADDPAALADFLPSIKAEIRENSSDWPCVDSPIMVRGWAAFLRRERDRVRSSRSGEPGRLGPAFDPDPSPDRSGEPLRVLGDGLIRGVERRDGSYGPSTLEYVKQLRKPLMV